MLADDVVNPAPPRDAYDSGSWHAASESANEGFAAANVRFRSYEPLDVTLTRNYLRPGNLSVIGLDLMGERHESSGGRNRNENMLNNGDQDAGGEQNGVQEPDSDVPLWSVIPAQIEERLSSIAAGNSPLLDWGNPELGYSIAPRRATWDLVREVEPTMEVLERRTQRAVLKLLRTKVEEQRRAQEQLIDSAAEDDMNFKIAREMARDLEESESSGEDR